MRVLLLTFYYSPDLSAGSFRSTALVRALDEQLPSGVELDVITTLPNRYASFSVDVPALERHGRVTVRRVALPRHRSGLADQSRAFLTFARAVLSATSGTRYALVCATSSRLMTATLASVIARRQRAPLYLDIRDIFVENIREVLPSVAAPVICAGLGLLERATISRANRVNVVSAGFAPYFRRRYPDLDFTVHTNGVDDEFITEFTNGATPRTHTNGGGVVTALYAGNIGEGQGLEEIIPALALRLRGRVRFRVIGDGGRRVQLRRRLDAQHLDNVDLIDPVSRDRLIAEYRSADVLFLHLNNYEAFRTVLPSKIFEYAATGKAIWAGVSGYSAEFLRDHVSNVALFDPCDAEAGEQAFTRLDLRAGARAPFVQTFSRRAITARMAHDIVAMLPTRN